DRGTTGAREDDPVLEAIAARGRARRRAYRVGNTLGRIGLAGRREKGNPHVVVLLEANGDVLADVHVGGITIDDVRREPNHRVLDERDVGNHVRRLETGQPLVRVDGEAHDGGAPRDLGGLPGAASARGADRHRRVYERPAVGATLDPQLPVGTGSPE